MKTTKEKIGLIMLTITGIGGLTGMIVGAYAESFQIGNTIVVILLWLGVMIKFLFDEK